MSDFGDSSCPKARKPYRCEYCLGPIPQGERHFKWAGVYDGEWQSWRMHEECHEDWDLNSDGYDNEFMAGDGEMPERVKALYAEAIK